MSVPLDNFYPVQQKMMHPEVTANDEDGVNSADAGLHENSLTLLDTITEEEEEDPSSGSFDTCENITVQHHCLPVEQPNSETDLLEARCLTRASHGMEWYVGETNLDYNELHSNSTTCVNLCRPFAPSQVLTGLSFPLKLAEIGFCETQLPFKTHKYSSYSFHINVSRRGSKSLPSVALPSDARPLRRIMSSSNSCGIVESCSLTNSKAPSPTRTQLNDVVEWALSSPGVTTITDNQCASLNPHGVPSPLAAAATCSMDTKSGNGYMCDREILEIEIAKSKMKRSPAVEGVCVLLQRPCTPLNDLPSDLIEPLSNGSPVDAESISTSESLTSSLLSLSRQDSDSSPMVSRPVYDYGTDETLLEIFMTPALDGMESNGDRPADMPLSCTGSTHQLPKQIPKSLPFGNLGTGLVWRDTCEKISNVDNQSGLLEDDSDLPFIDNEEWYSEAWYITASQQFSWLDRAQLADFNEITLYYGKSQEQLNKEEERKHFYHSTKLLFPLKHNQKKLSAPKRIRGFRKSESENRRWTPWIRLLCGCVSRNHGIV
ncbi:conserved hypothetical protein [Echinococcus multilocularis]|uniref:Uncharacterized protein n=1 Tax=Echinococcus multilocularis TaxID=6211 RepID=A0A068YJI3_ECHMU|nr:conserved hypothetical protein [Echinococcus multilocularis]